MSDEPRIVAADGLFTPEIKRHSLEKIRLHNRIAGIFSTAMRSKWPQRAYVGLYSGAGHARLADSNQVVETSALAVLRQTHPFTDYIYVDRDETCVNALRTRVQPLTRGARVTILHADVNDSVGNVRRALPPYSKNNGLLSFCFVDPFDLQFRFSTIRALSDLKMDFLVLLMLGVEAVHFMLERFDHAVQRVGYLSAADDAHMVKIPGMGVMLYVLAYYSKHETGKKFWKETRSSLNTQLGFGL